MRFVVVASLLVLNACGKPAPPPSPLVSMTYESASKPASPTPTATTAPGWTTTGGDFLLLGKQAPAFRGALGSGGETSGETLRGHWTIIAFRDADSADAEEDRFAAALNSAVDQDPDLDVLRVLVPTAQMGKIGQSIQIADKAPTVYDAERSISSAFGIAELPRYLLIGPDLTIEAIRGPLRATPDNGIKDVIRGVAEIRKQIADPS